MSNQGEVLRALKNIEEKLDLLLARSSVSTTLRVADDEEQDPIRAAFEEIHARARGEKR